MAQNRRAGTIYVSLNGERLEAKGAYTYNIGGKMREAIVGSDGIHGYKETEQVPFIEGAVTDSSSLDIAKLKLTDNATVVLELANGKVVTLRDAWFSGEGTVSTEEAEMAVRFEGLSAEEVK